MMTEAHSFPLSLPFKPETLRALELSSSYQEIKFLISALSRDVCVFTQTQPSEADKSFADTLWLVV